MFICILAGFLLPAFDFSTKSKDSLFNSLDTVADQLTKVGVYSVRQLSIFGAKVHDIFVNLIYHILRFSLSMCLCVCLFVNLLVSNRFPNYANYGDGTFTGDSVGLG